MAGGFDASGVYSRWYSWQDDAANGIKIEAVRHDREDDEFANALSICITKDGRTQPTENLPMNGKKIYNLGTPDQPGDAANKKYVDELPGWPVSKNIEGTNLNGRLNFTGSSGVNGITWTGADLSWVARMGEASKTSHRLVMNNTVAPPTTGTAGDVFIIDDEGQIESTKGTLTQNLSWDGTQWRTIVVGIGTQVTYGGGAFNLASNDVASTVDPYKSVTLRKFLDAVNSGGSALLRLYKSASGKSAYIQSFTGTEARWIMYFGDSTAEGSSGYNGSNFRLLGYDNTGANARDYMHIARDTQRATFYGDVYCNSSFVATTTTCILGAKSGGAIYFRPNGETSTVEQAYIDSVGDFRVSNDIYAGNAGTSSYGVYAGAGIKEKAGRDGGYGTDWINILYVGSGDTRVYAGPTHVGTVPSPCDYRLKKDVQPLESTWDKVKALKPVSYTYKDQGEKTDRREQWGFLAHQLQEDLLPSAASGKKDMKDGMQTPNPWALIAALTAALQEAMSRIEALEAKP